MENTELQEPELLVAYSFSEFPKSDWEIVTWNDDIQSLMDYPWFRAECYLLNSQYMLKKYGSSAYFVPRKRYDEWRDNGFNPYYVDDTALED